MWTVGQINDLNLGIGLKAGSNTYAYVHVSELKLTINYTPSASPADSPDLVPEHSYRLPFSNGYCEVEVSETNEYKKYVTITAFAEEDEALERFIDTASHKIHTRLDVSGSIVQLECRSEGENNTCILE
jgi:hypothetical protein